MRLKFPRLILHLEGLAVSIVSAIIFFYFIESNWVLFLVLFLVPDLSFFGYIVSNKFGAYSYNTMHNYVLPLTLLLFSLYNKNVLSIQISLIWISHIGVDRALGYGLKYSDKFKHTHLQEV